MTATVFNNRNSYVVKSAIFWFINAILILNSSVVISGEVWINKEFDAFCESSSPVSTNNLKTSLGKEYFRAVKDDEGMDLGKIKLPAIDALSFAISKAIVLKWSALEFFTDRHFTRGNPCILFLNKKLLQDISKEYDLHALWMVNPPLQGSDRQELMMEYLLLGDGKLIVGYSEGATIKVNDYRIPTRWFGSDKFEYEPYTSMDIINDGNKRGLFKIRVRKGPEKKPSCFIGPLNSKVSSLEVKDDKILVHYTTKRCPVEIPSCFGSKSKELFLRKIRIEQRK